MKSQMTIGRKISALCALLVVFTIIVGSISLLSVSRVDALSQSIVTDAMPGVFVVSRAAAAANDIRESMLTHIASNNQEDMTQMEAVIGQSQRKFQDILKEYEKSIFTPRDRELYEKIAPALDRLMGAWEKPRQLSRGGKAQEALGAFRTETAPAFKDFLKTITDEIEFNKTGGDDYAQQASSAASTGRFWIWTILLVATLAGAGLSVIIIRGVDNVLSRSVSELREGSEYLAGAASQVSSASQSLAQGSSEQAASLEETSASTEEISSMAHKNSENGQAASAEMLKTEQIVAHANIQLEQMMAAMKEITDSSSKVSKIIKVIDEIAFQTNILALNAAVEAARAGEAGMGFAVVAEEVRNLAQRSAQAAKDTAAMIEESIEKSTIGSRNLDQVAEGIRTITSSATTVKTLVDEVNLGSQEQARGIEQIAKAIAQMEQVTQKAAANAEESASASEELTAQSEKLKAIVEQLTSLVGGSASASRLPAAAFRKRTATAQSHASSLKALSTAVSRKPAAPVQAVAATSAEDSFPLDEFKEF